MTATTHVVPTDFDPLFGRWQVRNRKLSNVLDPGCAEWVEFDATVEVRPIFDGMGNLDFGRFDLDEPFEGMTVRLYDPEAEVWRIWWTSTRQPGHMEAPVEGRFTDGVGVFVAEEVLAGKLTKVKFEWTGLTAGAPRWEQSFSYDSGRSWKINWINTWTPAV